MQMTDLMPRENWAALEREIYERFRLYARAYDDKGFSFTGPSAWGNRLCPALRKTEQGIGAICSVAHQNVAAQAVREKSTIIEECDAGLIKVCSPVFVEGLFVGIIGGCGLLLEDSEIDPFLIEMTTGLPETEVQELAGTVETVSRERAEELARFLEERVAAIVADYKKTVRNATG